MSNVGNKASSELSQLYKFCEKVYKSDSVLKTKINIHNLYSVIPTDVFSEISSRIAIDKPLKILDIGCGTGDFLVYLAKINPEFELYGIDITKGVFKSGKEISDNEKLNIRFRRVSHNRIERKIY